MFLYNLITSGSSVPQILMTALAFVLAALSAIVIHENMHGFVAHLNGDDTAKNSGRLTLNPFAHFDWIGLLMFLFIGFGWAKPVPINPNNFKNRKLGMVLVSVAGVAANFVMAGLGLLLLFIFAPMIFKAMIASGTSSVAYILLYFVYALITYSTMINFMLGFFNLLPIYPLDGYNLLNSFLPEGNLYQMFMRKYGTFVLLGLIVIGQIGSMLNFDYINIFALFNNLIQRLIDTVIVAGIGG